jgi:hypothetical protein
MDDSQKKRNAKVIDEVSATLAAAAEQLTNAIEPAFVYQIEALPHAETPGDDE